jgi:predicted AAA+ superfamily ATPase
MTLTKKGYKQRLVDDTIAQYMDIFGAVTVEGPKWCGKTWTVLNHANSVFYVLDTSGGYSVREAVRINPKIALQGTPPVAIDEWQEAPAVWDAVRQAVDEEEGKGRFLLTGSVLKKGKDHKPVHSGAGRIARVRMYPMTLFESGDSDGRVSLKDIFGGIPFEAFLNRFDLERLVSLTVRGGWPGNLAVSDRNAGVLAREYLEMISTSDISESDGTERDAAKVTLLLRALARNISSDASNATLQRDIQNGSNSLSMPTITAYLDSLKRLYVLDEIPAWSPALRSKTRIRQAPKRIFSDPSLAVAALNTTSGKLLLDMSAFGYLFENMCLRDLAVYAAANEGRLYHYRDDSNLEVDAVIEMPDGAYGAFEIKVNPERVPEGLSVLKRFQEKMAARNAEPPRCLAVITGGGTAQRRADGICIVPVTSLRN